MLQERLRHFKKTQELIEIGRRNYTAENLLCQVRAISNFVIQVAEYNQHGDYNGISILFLDDITDVLWETRELISIQKLARMKTPFEVPELKLNSIASLLEDIRQRFGSVVIYNETLGNVGMHGEILGVEEQWVHLKEFSPRRDGARFESILRLDYVTRISTDSLYLKDLHRIHEAR